VIEFATVPPSAIFSQFSLLPAKIVESIEKSAELKEAFAIPALLPFLRIALSREILFFYFR